MSDAFRPLRRLTEFSLKNLLLIEPRAWCKAARAGSLVWLGMFVVEFLPADRGFVHQATLADHEGQHALAVRGISLHAGTTARSHTRASSGRAHAGLHASGDGDRRSLCVELEIAAREVLIGALVLEKYDLAIGLSPQLKPDRDLRHRRKARNSAAGIDLAFAMCAAYEDGALADRREDGVAVCRSEIGGDGRVAFEHVDGPGVVLDCLASMDNSCD